MCVLGLRAGAAVDGKWRWLRDDPRRGDRGARCDPDREHGNPIDTAVSQADRVTRIVVDGRGAGPTGGDSGPGGCGVILDATVIAVPDIGGYDDSAAWAQAARDAVDHGTIDAVFDSEPYGPGGRRPSPGSREPTAATCSSDEGSCRSATTAGGRTPPGTGTTSTTPPRPLRGARRVARSVPPARPPWPDRLPPAQAEDPGAGDGRDYTLEKYTIGTGDRELPNDFLRIALEQNALEDRMAGECLLGILFCDTDALATARGRRSTWGPRRCRPRWRRGATEPGLAGPADGPRRRAWEDDGLRLGDDTRARMYRASRPCSSGGCPS